MMSMQPGLAKRYRGKIIERIAMAAQINKKVEDELYIQLQAVAHFLSKYYRENQSFPVAPMEIEVMKNDIGCLLPANPYALAEASNPSESQNANRIKIATNRLLNQGTIEEIVADAPNSWLSEPGTISIITNGTNLALVWAAGFNWRAIKDQKTGEVIFFVVN